MVTNTNPKIDMYSSSMQQDLTAERVTYGEIWFIGDVQETSHYKKKVMFAAVHLLWGWREW